MPSKTELLVMPIEEAAIELARYHKKAEPKIRGIYLFSHPKEIRLIELDPTTLPSSQIEPWYFSEDPANGILFPSAVALIRPEEKDKLQPPKGWGRWSDAKRIWPEKHRSNGRRLAKRIR